MTLCTSIDCPERYRCARQARDDIDEEDDTYYNFENNWCNQENGFSDYIKQ